MKKIAAVLALLSISSLVNAIDWPSKLVMDKVVFQVSARQWVTTQSALLTVNINATLTNADLVKARADIMKNLNKISVGEWQITQFDRSQDSSGLDKLYVAAQARIPQTNLPDIYQSAKTITKPGATYEINSIEFKPSIEEVQQVKQQLREHLYEQVNNEVERLNKVYTNQKYSVNRIFFFEGDQVLPMAKAYQASEMKPMVLNAVATSSPALTVNNELIMNAMIELASNRQEANTVAAN